MHQYNLPIERKTSEKVNYKGAVMIVAISFFVALANLWAGLAISLFVCFQREYIRDFRSRYGAYIIFGGFLGVLNSTKSLEYSDISYYVWLYEFAGRKSLAEYVALIPKEPLFFIYTYIGRLATFGSVRLFIVLTTILMYFPVMAGYDILARRCGFRPVFVLTGALLFMFFLEYFFYTSQIMRQVLAGSIAFYCIAKATFCRSRLAFVGIAAAGLFHASAFVFMIYYVVYFCRKMNPILLVAIILASVFALSFVMSAMSSFVDETSTMGYALKRGVEGNSEEVYVKLMPLLVTCASLPMSFYIIIRERRDKLICSFFIVPSFLVAFILLNASNPLFVLRFMEYIYMYLPLCVMFICAIHRMSWIMVVAVALMFVRFATGLNKGDFSFMSLADFSCNGILSLIF